MNSRFLGGRLGAERWLRRSVGALCVALFTGLSAPQTQAQPIRPVLDLGGKKAPVTIVVFSDFQCPYCARLVPILKRLMENNPDDIRIVFKNFPLDIHREAVLAHEAALVAASQNRFWEMHDLIFADQSRIDRATLMGYGRKLGLDTERLARALDSRSHRELIDSDMADGVNLGVIATPTLFVNGVKFVGMRSVDVLQAAVDEQLGRQSKTPQSQGPPKFDLARAAFRGSPSAPVTIVEFSDLQCPYCARATTSIEEALIRFQGKVRWAFKHFPLPFHADAPLAHEAILAAGEQGRFWEMHDAIFRQQSAIKRDDLIKLAAGLGLSIDRFIADLDSRRFKPVVDSDRQEGERAGVTGTPTFFVNGVRLVGAVPTSELTAIIEKALARGTAEASAPTQR
jgi:protein-disulfide isomerase